MLCDGVIIAGDTSLYTSARAECMCKLSMQTFELFGQQYAFETDVQPIVVGDISEGSEMFGIPPFFIKTGKTCLSIEIVILFGSS